MNKEKALKNQGLEFREDIISGGGSCADRLSDCTLVIYKKTLFLGKMDFSALT